ncbi:MAG: hypothetical protein WCI74_09630 [Actinomycetes bacterium]
MNIHPRRIAMTAATACALFGIAVVSAGPASAAAPSAEHTSKPTSSASAPSTNAIDRMVNMNWTDHDLSMTITLGDGTVLRQVVKARSIWSPDGDYTLGKNVIIVKDDQGVAFAGTFTYDGDWVAGQMDTTPRLRFVWHTGPFGGFDFR